MHVSPAKITFRVVTADRWAVAVSLMPRHYGGRHVRHFPAARADSDDTNQRRGRRHHAHTKREVRAHGKEAVWGAFAALLEEVS